MRHGPTFGPGNEVWASLMTEVLVVMFRIAVDKYQVKSESLEEFNPV